MPERDATGRALLVAAAVALVCSLIVSLAVSWLRPIQLAHRAAAQGRSVLVAAGLTQQPESLDAGEAAALFLELEPRLVDLDAGRFLGADASMIAAHDYRAAVDDPAASREIAPSLDLASIGRRPLAMPVYLHRDADGLDRVVLPVYGQGMWSTIHAYVVLDGSLMRVESFHVIEHGETPGIGDRISDPSWLAAWPGRRVFGADGAVVLRIGGAGDGPADQRIDGITGATVTVEAVDRLVRYWLGEDGYGPFLDWLRRQEAADG